jgi:hypothetical protein
MNALAVSALAWRGCAAAGGLLLGLSGAQAGDHVLRFAQSNPCAIYGSGYVAVHGAGGCARIGGRVRLRQDSSARAVAGPPDGLMGFAAEIDTFDGPSAAHLRLPGERRDPTLPRTR